MEYNRLYALQKRLQKRSTFEYRFSKAGTHFILVWFSTPANFKETNTHLTFAARWQDSSSAWNKACVYLPYTTGVRVYLSMTGCMLCEFGRNSASCAADNKAENGNLAKCCNVNCSNLWTQATKIPVCFFAWTEIC